MIHLICSNSWFIQELKVPYYAIFKVANIVLGVS